MLLNKTRAGIVEALKRERNVIAALFLFSAQSERIEGFIHEVERDLSLKFVSI